MDYKIVKKCRACGSRKLKPYLDLGLKPLANSYEVMRKFPLRVLFCKECCLSQLSVVVSPELMFSNYPYHSSVSESFKSHCAKMARTAKRMSGEVAPSMVDIASNDGALLQEFSNAGFYVMGVEPAKNLADEANARGLDTLNEFFSQEAAERLPAVRVMTATNVLAHVDDLHGFLKAANSLLRKQHKSFLIVEVPYLYDLITNNQFDTIYHEHLSYFLLKPLKKAFEACGLSIFKVERQKIHGGSLRVYASPLGMHDETWSVREMMEFEKKAGMYSFAHYKKFSANIEKLGTSLNNLLATLKLAGKKVYAYGASAKGAMLINNFRIDSRLVDFVVDDTPCKQGRFMPDSDIMIVDKGVLSRYKPDYILILAWNFAAEIMKKTKEIGSKYIIPIPEVKVV